MLNEREYELLSQLVARGSMQSLQGCIKEWNFADFQTYALAFCYIRERMIISLDTGLGKTLIAAGLINLDISNNKWIFVSKSTNLAQNAKKLNQLLYGKTVTYTNGEARNVTNALYKGFTADVIMMTYECFESPLVQEYIFKTRHMYSGIIIDESHAIGNMGSIRSEMLKHMLRNCFRYQFLLTATPLTVDPVQLLNQVNIIDQELVPDPESMALRYSTYKNGVLQSYHHLDDLRDYIEERYLSITRTEMNMRGNYKPQLILTATPNGWKDLHTPEGIQEYKSQANNSALQEVIKIVNKKTREGKRGLIYANLEVYKSLLVDSLKDICRVDRLDGTIKNKEKDVIQHDFNNGQYDVLVSNLLEGRDLPCDYIIFYEMTVLFKQFIGRGERGLQGQDLELYFPVVNKSYDISYFYRNVYKRGLILEKLCNKDVSELKVIEKQLESALDFEDRLDLEELKTAEHVY